MYLTHSNLYTAWRDNDDYTIFMIVLLNWRAKRRAKKIRKYFIVEEVPREAYMTMSIRLFQKLGKKAALIYWTSFVCLDNYCSQCFGGMRLTFINQRRFES